MRPERRIGGLGQPLVALPKLQMLCIGALLASFPVIWANAYPWPRFVMRTMRVWHCTCSFEARTEIASQCTHTCQKSRFID